MNGESHGSSLTTPRDISVDLGGVELSLPVPSVGISSDVSPPAEEVICASTVLSELVAMLIICLALSSSCIQDKAQSNEGQRQSCEVLPVTLLEETKVRRDNST